MQWYPGHIGKAEKELKEQLKLMDVVIEVRDARIPLSTTHPEMDSWLGNRKRILVLNREDMISKADRNAWAAYFSRQGMKVIFANGKLGMGSTKLGRLAKDMAANINIKRRAKGLLPRAVGFLTTIDSNLWLLSLNSLIPIHNIFSMIQTGLSVT
ncbi:unnamed protein product [Linum tenue]|uniref:Uncharacterized protein n=1 Tax=Linum tenue TaxID=586396 RepID=A0AAV0MRI1_9ROSI|nr:unnamed protein product [Linum tenue]